MTANGNDGAAYACHRAGIAHHAETAEHAERSLLCAFRELCVMFRKAGPWGVAMWLVVSAAHAQTPLRLTLDDAISRGISTSHRLAEARARGEAAQAVVGERHAAALPQVAALGGYQRTNHIDPFAIAQPAPLNRIVVVYPDVPDNYRSRLDLQWPVYTGGRVDALERAARIEATASADDIATARADLTLDITRAFWTLVTAGEAAHVVDEALQRIGAHLRDIRNQLQAGLVPPSDVLTVEAQEARQRMLSIQARTARDVAEAELARLVGVVPGTAIDPAVALELPPPANTAVDALIERARAQRPERAALLKRIAAARERTVAAEAGRLPTVAVGGGVDYARPNPRVFPREAAWKSSWDASVNVNWPLFDGGRARSEAAEAAANTRATEERLADVDAALEVELRQRLSEVQASRAAVEAAAVGVRSATEARRVLGERFAAGVATNTEVLDAQVALLQAELDRTQAIANARLADARLARALGQ
jgi:outer membrane protein